MQILFRSGSRLEAFCRRMGSWHDNWIGNFNKDVWRKENDAAQIFAQSLKLVVVKKGVWWGFSPHDVREGMKTIPARPDKR